MSPPKNKTEEMNILLPARILFEKGIYEFFEAANTQNIFHLVDDHFFNIGQNIDKSINNLNNAKKNFSDMDKFLEEIFKLTSIHGLKRKKK